MTIIYDGNNWVRLQLETSTLGKSGPRSIYDQLDGQPETAIMVWDGKGALAARRQYFPDYKIKRKPATAEIYINFDVVRAVLEFANIIQIRVPGYEADDIIAAIAKPGDTVFSTDRDFYQIPGINLPMSRPYDLTPEEVRAYKSLVGDSSDGIPGLANFGEKTWQAADPEFWLDWVKEVVNGNETIPEVIPKRVTVDFDRIRLFWKIVGFLDVPEELMANNITIGRRNPHAADLFLKELLQ